MSIDDQIESVNPTDSITRYVFSNRQLRKSDQRPKSSLFKPMFNKFKQRKETSVFQICNLTSNEVFEIGKRVEEQNSRTLLGRVDLKISQILSSHLDLDPNNEGLPRHGDIIGWHPEDELLQTQVLAEQATGFIPVEGV